MKPGYDGNFTILEPVNTEIDGEKKATVRNLTRDMLAFLHKRGTLSTQEFEAGRRLQKIRERAAIGGIKAQEYERVFQDADVVGGKDSHVPEQVAWAFWKLRAVRRNLGEVHWKIVKLVAFENMTGPEMVKQLPRHNKNSVGPAIAYAFEELCNVIDRD